MVFNDIVSFNSKTIPLKRFGLDSERNTFNDFPLILQLQPKSIILKKVLMMNQNPTQILLVH